MTWHYAMSRWEDEQGKHFAVHEVYLNEDGSLSSWSAEPIRPSGETWQEAAEDLAQMASAIGRPVLDLTVDPPRMIPWPMATSD